MKSGRPGFTIVELLVVVVVLGIVISISTFAWGAVSNWARDQARQNDTEQWAATFDSYKGRFTVYPALPASVASPKTLCLGSFSTHNDKCGQFTSPVPGRFLDASSSNTDHTALNDEVKKVGDLPTNSGPAINDILVGPIVYLSRNSDVAPMTVTAQFINFFTNDCPDDFTDISASLPVPLQTVMSGLPSGTNTHVCAISKQFTYSPS